MCGGYESKLKKNPETGKYDVADTVLKYMELTYEPSDKSFELGSKIVMRDKAGENIDYSYFLLSAEERKKIGVDKLLREAAIRIHLYLDTKIVKSYSDHSTIDISAIAEGLKNVKPEYKDVVK